MPGPGTTKELGWYWLTTRSYDPALERFLQPDPSQSEGIFTYVYAGDDPVDYGDTSGMMLTSRVGSCPDGVCSGGVNPNTVGPTTAAPAPPVSQPAPAPPAGSPAAAAPVASTAAPVYVVERTSTGGTVMVNYYNLAPTAQASYANFTDVQAALSSSGLSLNGAPPAPSPGPAPTPTPPSDAATVTPTPSQPGPADQLTRERQIAEMFGYTVGQVKQAIHGLKNKAGVSGPAARNPDIVVDGRNGDIYVQLPGGRLSEDPIGNIHGQVEEGGSSFSASQIRATVVGAVGVAGVGAAATVIWWVGKLAAPVCGPAAPLCVVAF